MGSEDSPTSARRWPVYMRPIAVWIAGVVALVGLLEFLAPDLSYEIKDRAHEWTTSRAGKPYRLRVGSMTGSAYRVGATLNRHLRARAGYELELVANSSPASVIEMLQGSGADKAGISSGDVITKVDGKTVGSPSTLTSLLLGHTPSQSVVVQWVDQYGSSHKATVRLMVGPPQ